LHFLTSSVPQVQYKLLLLMWLLLVVMWGFALLVLLLLLGCVQAPQAAYKHVHQLEP
jgi:hypothetical protein